MKATACPSTCSRSTAKRTSFAGRSSSAQPDKINPRKDTFVFCFALEPDKVMTMMDGLDELTGEEKDLLEPRHGRDEEESAGHHEQGPDAGPERPGRSTDQGALYHYKGFTGEFDIIGSLRTGSTRVFRS